MPWTYLVNVWLERSFELGGTSLSAFVWIDNLFDPTNVVDAYGTTGRPDDDGRLASSDGHQYAPNFGALERTNTTATAWPIRIIMEFRGS